MKKDDRMRLFAGLDIPFYSEKIKQPTLHRIIEYGWDSFFKKICLPYKITFDYLEYDQSYIDENNITIFDWFWLPLSIEEKPLLSILEETIKFTFNVNEVVVDNQNNRFIINDLIIDRNNFTELVDYCRRIFVVNPLRKEDKEEEKKDIPEHLRERYERYKKNQAKHKSDSIVEILQAMNYIVHNQSTLDYTSLLKLTIFQFFNTQESYIKKEDYNNSMRGILAGTINSKKADSTHWKAKVKIKE